MTNDGPKRVNVVRLCLKSLSRTWIGSVGSGSDLVEPWESRIIGKIAC